MISFNEFCSYEKRADMQAVNEGFLQKIKDFFVNVYTKIKNFIFDAPVVATPDGMVIANNISLMGKAIVDNNVKGVIFGSPVANGEFAFKLPEPGDGEMWTGKGDELMESNTHAFVNMLTECAKAEANVYRSDRLFESDWSDTIAAKGNSINAYPSTDVNRASTTGYSAITGFGKTGAKDGKQVNITDITTDDLYDMIQELVENRHNVSTGSEEGVDDKTYLVFGIPGIGKTTIPKTIIRAWNEAGHRRGDKKRIGVDPETGKDVYLDTECKKAMIVMNCADLNEDSFGVTSIQDVSNLDKAGSNEMKRRIMAKFVNTGNFAWEDPNPADLNKATGLYKVNLSDPNHYTKIKSLNSTIKTDIQEAITAPVSWLPVYKRTGDPNVNKLLDTLANSCVYEDKKSGKTMVANSGGILFFDEFLRCQTKIMAEILMQWIQQREYKGEFAFGSLWTFLLASNRPNDDHSVDEMWQQLGGALIQRFVPVNLLPDKDSWFKYLEGEYGKDAAEPVINFLKNSAYSKYFHENPEIDKVLTGEHAVFATPRSWDECLHSATIRAKSASNPLGTTWLSFLIKEPRKFAIAFETKMGKGCAHDFFEYLVNNKEYIAMKEQQIERKAGKTASTGDEDEDVKQVNPAEKMFNVATIIPPTDDDQSKTLQGYASFVINSCLEMNDWAKNFYDKFIANDDKLLKGDKANNKYYKGTKMVKMVTAHYVNVAPVSLVKVFDGWFDKNWQTTDILQFCSYLFFGVYDMDSEDPNDRINYLEQYLGEYKGQPLSEEIETISTVCKNLQPSLTKESDSSNLSFTNNIVMMIIASAVKARKEFK